MLDPNFIILYVDDPRASARFYGDLLSLRTLEESPTFAMLALRPGVMLGLWSRHTVEPAAAAGGGGTEIAFALDPGPGSGAVDAVYADWVSGGSPSPSIRSISISAGLSWRSIPTATASESLSRRIRPEPKSVQTSASAMARTATSGVNDGAWLPGPSRQ